MSRLRDARSPPVCRASSAGRTSGRRSERRGFDSLLRHHFLDACLRGPREPPAKRRPAPAGSSARISPHPPVIYLVSSAGPERRFTKPEVARSNRARGTNERAAFDNGMPNGQMVMSACAQRESVRPSSHSGWPWHGRACAAGRSWLAASYAKAAGALAVPGPICVLTFRSPLCASSGHFFDAPPFFKLPWFSDIAVIVLDGQTDCDDMQGLLHPSWRHLAGSAARHVKDAS